ncbi:MAG: hypothetical protein JRG94_17375 [Deltaproteobacteria bacterium]|nr:hypothetical protein [Deltaproteobacteria bacterium]
MPEVEITASTVEEIRKAIARVARRVGASVSQLPTYGHSDQSGRPHLELQGDTWSYVVCERGSEFERRETRDSKEILYWVFELVTSEMAFSFELQNRTANRDSRRVAFGRQLELLGSLDDSWAARALDHQRAVLAEHPYDDAASERAQRSKELRDAGHSDSEAWGTACSEYPLPSSTDV